MDFNKTEKIVGYVRWVCLNTPFSGSDKPTIQSAHTNMPTSLRSGTTSILCWLKHAACENHILGWFNLQPPLFLLIKSNQFSWGTNILSPFIRVHG